MHKTAKSILLVLVICALSFFIFRVYSLNKYFAENFPMLLEVYSMGDIVEFEDNYIDGDIIDGYAIEVKSAKIINFNDYIDEFDINEPLEFEIEPPERVCEVSIIIYNYGSVSSGLYLPSIILQGLDYYTDWNSDLLHLANPILEQDSLGLTLADNTQFEAKLVFNIREMHFTTNVWDDLGDYDLWLKLTDYPIIKRIQLDITMC